MALYPKAIDKIIKPGANDPKIRAVGLVLHVRDGTGSSLYDYFANKSGGIESHFYIRYDGVVEQYRDTNYEADAQYHGNSFPLDGARSGLLSVETEGANHGAWTTAQLNAIKALIEWAHVTHGIPFRVCPAWNSPGIGYHTMWGSPSQWTPVAKSCPGPDRIRQFREVITPWLKTASAVTPTQNPAAAAANPPEEDMREVLTYAGTAYFCDGFFRSTIPNRTALHVLIDPKPKGLGVPNRAVDAGELAMYVDTNQLMKAVADANASAAATRALLVEMQEKLAAIQPEEAA